jgi:hypothetical protein
MARRIIVMSIITLFVAPILAMAQEGKMPEMDSATAAMMTEWTKYATPGVEHQGMARAVGKWTYTSTMWMDPAAPAIETKGTLEVFPILDGRYFTSVYKGELMGQPFEGIATSGYDLYKKQYFSTWIDNTGTMIMMSTGTCKPDGSECTFTTSYEDPVLKVTKNVRQVTRWTNADSFVFEWYEAWPGQAERKTMEITHTRVK